jgi:hypothetical protein
MLLKMMMCWDSLLIVHFTVSPMQLALINEPTPEAFFYRIVNLLMKCGG